MTGLFSTPENEDIDPAVYINEEKGRLVFFVYPDSEFFVEEIKDEPVRGRNGPKNFEKTLQEAIDLVRAGRIRDIDIYHSVLMGDYVREVPRLKELLREAQKNGVVVRKRVDYEPIFQVIDHLQKMAGHYRREFEHVKSTAHDDYGAVVLRLRSLRDELNHAIGRIDENIEALRRDPVELVFEVSP